MEEINQKKKAKRKRIVVSKACASPCKNCPYKKDATVEGPFIGGTHISEYIGQLLGPFWLPCHADPNYEGNSTPTGSTSKCRGAMRMRYKMPNRSDFDAHDLLSTAPDINNEVFDNIYEFLQHYLKIPMVKVTQMYDSKTLGKLVVEERLKVLLKRNDI